jgi:nucleotide-binding universal stress UspA family protein
MTKDEALDLALEALEAHADIGIKSDKAITAIKQARALYTTPPAQPASEEDMKVYRAIADNYRKDLAAAQRQWVGLTDEAIWSEYQTLWPFHPAEEPGLAKDIAKFARAIEAKLKEKNGWYRQHVIDGSPCWCEPETSYTDPETGASVVVHKEPQ